MCEFLLFMFLLCVLPQCYSGYSGLGFVSYWQFRNCAEELVK